MTRLQFQVLGRVRQLAISERHAIFVGVTAVFHLYSCQSRYHDNFLFLPFSSSPPLTLTTFALCSLVSP